MDEDKKNEVDIDEEAAKLTVDQMISKKMDNLERFDGNS